VACGTYKTLLERISVVLVNRLARVGAITNSLGIKSCIHAAFTTLFWDKLIFVKVTATLGCRVCLIQAALKRSTSCQCRSVVIQVCFYWGNFCTYSCSLWLNESYSTFAEFSSIKAIPKRFTKFLHVANLTANLSHIHLRASVVIANGVFCSLWPACEINFANKVTVAGFAFSEELFTGGLEWEDIIRNTAKAHVTFIVMNTSWPLILAFALTIYTIWAQTLQWYITLSSIIELLIEWCYILAWLSLILAIDWW